MKLSMQRRPGQTASTALQTHPHCTALHQWLRWCSDNGVEAVSLILYKWVRTNAPNKSHSNRSLGVKLKDDCIHVKIWTTDQSFTFFDYKLHTPAKLRSQQANDLKIRQAANEQHETAHVTATQQAQTLWHETVEALVSGYLVRKGLSATHGARWHVGRQCWMVLLTDVHGKFGTIQSIYNEKRNGNDKWFLKGARKTGLMVLVGVLHDGITQVLVCEGFATGATLHEETGMTVACAMDCGNMQPVCEAIRAAYPLIDIVVCGDDDRRPGQNPGRQKAIDSAKAVRGRYCFPTFDANCANCTDFNDSVNCLRCGSVS